MLNIKIPSDRLVALGIDSLACDTRLISVLFLMKSSALPVNYWYYLYHVLTDSFADQLLVLRAMSA